MGKGKAAVAAVSQKPSASAPLVQSVEADITPEQREHMIAEAAYYHAEHRGFQEGDPRQDWLMAEAEINQMLGGKLH